MATTLASETHAPNSTVAAHGVNGISLGIHEVFDRTQEAAYLRARHERWNIGGPPGFEPRLRALPPIHDRQLLHLATHAKVAMHDVDELQQCAHAVMDHYFPPVGDEAVLEDTFTFTAAPFEHFPAGTAVVVRRTNKAVLFYLNPNVHVDADGHAVRSIRTTGAWAPPMRFAASPVDEAKIVMKIYGSFASLLPGPVGTIAKAGIELVNMILGMAGPSGPSWTEIQSMMREVVRDELITNDLEFVQAHLEKVKKWAEIQYLPNRSHKSKEQLWQMLLPQIDLVTNDINLLLQSNHRIPGFGLLLLGVDTYMGLLQEQVMLGYDANIRKAGDQWATSMLTVWAEVQKHRHDQIVFEKPSYAVFLPPDDVMTAEYWRWIDRKTGEVRGDRNGPWQAGGKPDRSEEGCRHDAEARYEGIILPRMIRTFGDPEATAKAWRTVRVPD